MKTCSLDNTQAIDQSSFWSEDGVHWDAHRIGWAISGGCALLTVIISMISVFNHCRNYTIPAEQRQIIRILYMPPVYAIISFFSYRFFRSYTYYELIEVVYEAITLSAFMLLIIEYVSATATDHSARKALERKDKRKLPVPFCCWRYRPTKAYFMYTMKWLVMQYVVVRPLVSIVGIICQALNILCQDEGFTHFEYAYPYLAIVDFISISLALYGLWMFYQLTKEELKEQRPFAKFLCIKLIVMFTFYQTFVFELLEGRVIKATAYWTETNIANGLNALAICIEMVFFALAMMWSYPSSPYKQAGVRTKIGRPLLDSINFSDFGTEIWSSVKFFIAYMRGKPGTRTPKKGQKLNFAQAFGVEGAYGSSMSGYDDGLGRYPSFAPASGYTHAPSSIAIPGQHAPGLHTKETGNGRYPSSGTGLGVGNPAGRRFDDGRSSGREGSIDQYGEEVHLTTFPPRNGAMSTYGRESDETDGTYPQVPYPPQSQYNSSNGRKQY